MENVIIKTENETIKLTAAEYEAVAAYVRNRDKMEYAFDVLCNNLSCIDKEKENIEDYLVRPENLKSFANKLDEAINRNSGEIESECVDEAVKESEPGIYRIISNKGTEDEQENMVVLPIAFAHEIEAGIMRETDLSGVMLRDRDGDLLDAEYFSTIEFVSVFQV